MPALPAVVRRTCRRFGLFSPGARVLVAVSGGPDSVALLHVLREFAPDLGLELGVAHFNHRIRAEASDADAGFVAGIAAQLGIAFHLGGADVPALAAEKGLSTETAAREARYSFLRRTAAASGYSRIAVGHTRDDQAETVLLAVIRGSGLGGLGGMAPLAGDIARPLLDATREDIIAYLGAHGLAFHTDESNLSLDYTRNRLRHVLIPLLEREFNPDVKGALARLAETLRVDEEFLTRVAAGFLRDAAEAGGAEAGARAAEGTPAAMPRPVQLSLDKLNEAALAVRRRAVREAARTASGQEVSPLTFVNVEDVLGLLDGKTGGSVDLPAGLIARLGYGYLELSARPAPEEHAPPSSPEAAPVVASVEKPVTVASGAWELLFSAAPNDMSAAGGQAKWQRRPDASGGCSFRAVLDLDLLSLPFVIRPLRCGDRFWPHGAPGERKLQDFLTDAKVPRSQRGLLPLLVDASGRIAAVLPMRAAHWATVGGQTRRVLVIEGRVGDVPFLARSLRSC